MPESGGFHDRRIVIPNTPFEAYGLGLTPTTSTSATLARSALSAVGGHCTTSDSLDHNSTDDDLMAKAGSVVKDMEFAAICGTAGFYGVDVVGVKVVTDIVDGDR